MNTAQFISIFNSGGNPLGPFQERVAADGGTVEGLDNMLAKYDASASWQLIPSAVKAGTAYAQVPNSSLGDLTVTRASSGTFTNSAGVVQTAASNVLRTDYRNADGTLSTTGRYLLEPQRTNSIRNSSMVGAVAGSPGTAPTNWSGLSSGLTRTITSIGSENGLPYIEARFNGTASGTIAQFTFETISAIPATALQTWALSTYVKYVSGTANTAILAWDEYTSGSAYLTSKASSVLTVGGTLSRVAFTATTSTNCSFVQPYIRFALTSGQTYDFTIRIAAPQMELGAYATTWVPTTTAAVTRLADSARKTGVSSLIGQTEGTLYAEFFSTSNSNSDVIQLQATTAIDNIVAIGCGSGSIFGVVYANGGYRFQPIILRTIPGEKFKVALCYKTNDFTFFINGVKVASGTSNYTPLAPLTKVLLNETTLFGRQAINYDNALIIPNKLSDADAIQLTTL